jgi:ABC-type uncharacterized transport system auxiliary subunit
MSSSNLRPTESRPRSRPIPAAITCGVVILILAATLGACADKRVTLTYRPDPTTVRLAPAPNAVTVFDFADLRGSEGDHDVFRVGGIYAGVLSRLVKVMTDTPWPRSLSRALADGFAARGVPATLAYQPFVPGASFGTPLALVGDIRNFSTEFRFATTAHVSGVVRLVDRQGRILVEKRVEDRETWDLDKGAPTSDQALEATLNQAIAGFVSKVVNDPDIDRVVADPSLRP